MAKMLVNMMKQCITTCSSKSPLWLTIESSCDMFKRNISGLVCLKGAVGHNVYAPAHSTLLSISMIALRKSFSGHGKLAKWSYLSNNKEELCNAAPLFHTYSTKFSSLGSESTYKETSMDLSWRPPPPCKVGDKKGDIDTPALVLNMDRLEHNLCLLPKLMEKYHGVQHRVHVKAHKCPSLAALQVKHGAVGVCAQTLVEAEAMVYGGGISDVLVSNQLIGKPKLRRLANLAKKAEVSICVDDLDNLKDLSEVSKEQNVHLGVVVEVNVGQDRCGVEPGSAAIPLAHQATDLPNVFFKGIQCYQGWNQHVRQAEDREAAVDKVVQLTKETLTSLEGAGISCSYVTGGGTGTFPYEAASGVFTEVQPGSYVLMDVDYGKNYGEDGKLIHDFQHSMLILSTVQSVTPGQRAVVDAGMKAISMDSGVPRVCEEGDLVYNIGGDEHGILTPSGNLKVGDQVWLIPGHCDPTMNLYDWVVGLRGDNVEAVWPVQGRGPGV